MLETKVQNYKVAGHFLSRLDKPVQSSNHGSCKHHPHLRSQTLHLLFNHQHLGNHHVGKDRRFRLAKFEFRFLYPASLLLSFERPSSVDSWPFKVQPSLKTCHLRNRFHCTTAPMAPHSARPSLRPTTLRLPTAMEPVVSMRSCSSFVPSKSGSTLKFQMHSQDKAVDFSSSLMSFRL